MNDMYKKRNLEQINNDVKTIEEFDPYNLGLSGMNGDLDSDLKKKLLDAKKELEMEQAELKRQDEYSEMMSQLDSNISTLNPGSFETSRSNFQTESQITNMPQKYSQEEVINARAGIERNIQLGQELLASLGLTENEEIEEHSMKHR